MTFKTFYADNPEFLSRVIKMRRMFYLTAHGACNINKRTGDPEPLELTDCLRAILTDKASRRKEFKSKEHPFKKEEKDFLTQVWTVIKGGG